MDDYTAVVAKAAQFYEEVSQEPSNGSPDVQKRLDVQVVTVFPGKRQRGFASAHRYSHARTEIELALLLALSQSFLSVSGETWRQRRGVPIGGMASKILCSVVPQRPSVRKTSSAGSLSDSVGTMMSQTSVTWMTLSH